jgi:hypothetical protein
VPDDFFFRRLVPSAVFAGFDLVRQSLTCETTYEKNSVRRAGILRKINIESVGQITPTQYPIQVSWSRRRGGPDARRNRD